MVLPLDVQYVPVIDALPWVLRAAQWTVWLLLVAWGALTVTGFLPLRVPIFKRRLDASPPLSQ